MGFPKELTELKQWVCWRLIPDKKSGKDKKMPFNPTTGKAAASNNSQTWTDYNTAYSALKKYGYTGIGFVFTKESGIVGVDIDHCYDPETKTFNAVASDILEHCNTYTEFSPSGTGIHLYFKGIKPEGSSKNTSNGVEMYDSVRFFTVTHNQVEGTPETISDDADVLKWIYETYLVKQKNKAKKKRVSFAPLTDEELIDKASNAQDGGSFAKLWSGNWSEDYSSQSEADMALCMKLVFWSGRNREQCDRLFRQSGLFREKWDTQHHANGATYGEETLNKALDIVSDVYSPGKDKQIVELDGRYFRTKGDTMYPITNFVIRPIEMIVSPEETQLTAELVTVRGEKFRLTFMTSDFANTQKFKVLLNKYTISLSYFGADGDLELLKEYISSLIWTKKTGIKAIGIYKHNDSFVFVSSDRAIGTNGMDVEDIVQLEKHKSICSEILNKNLLDKQTFKELGTMILSYNEPEKTVSILSWIAGCFLKTKLRDKGIKFPHLFLVGEAGSGKSTTLEKIILPIFSTAKVNAATQVTSFTLMKDAASSNTIPLVLDEFKPSKMDKIRLNALYNHFRDSYDTHDGTRGRADQTLTVYELSAPVIVAGEESAEETAIRERSVELLFSKKDLKKTDNRLAFNRISGNKNMLHNFGRTLLCEALKIDENKCKEWHEIGISLFSQELPDRIVNNLACAYVGLQLVDTVCKSYGLTWNDVFPYKFESCIKNLESAARDYLLDGGTNNQSNVEQTFEIMARMQLDPRNDFEISKDGHLLYLRLPNVYDAYTKYRRDYAIVGEVLTYAQFKKQLMYSDVFVQANVQKKIAGENRKCWVIDFEALQKKCDVSGFIISSAQRL